MSSHLDEALYICVDCCPLLSIENGVAPSPPVQYEEYSVIATKTKLNSCNGIIVLAICCSHGQLALQHGGEITKSKWLAKVTTTTTRCHCADCLFGAMTKLPRSANIDRRKIQKNY